MTIPSEIPITDTYNDVKRLIHLICSKYYQKSDMDFSELVSEANEAFLKAYEKYDPNRGAFTTMLYHTIHNHLRSVLKRRSKWSNVWKTNTRGDNSICKDFNWTEFAESLSKDGELVVKLIFDGPNDIGRAIHIMKSTRRNWKKVLKIYLSNLGWEHRRIMNSFKEVRETL